MEWINRRIMLIPARLQAVIDSERGELIGYGGWPQAGETSRRKQS
jgi:hypothetical protein